MAFSFHVETILAELASTDTTAKRLTVTSWNGRPPKLDLRTWRTDDGDPQPNRGITLTDEEARELLHALAAYFNGDQSGRRSA